VPGIALVTDRVAPLGVDVPVTLYAEEIPLELVEQVEFYVPPYMGSVEQMALMPNLRVCQLLTAGYETALPFLPPGATLCNARGVHDSSTAELAVALMLASLRGIDVAARDMPRGVWGHERRQALADHRVLVIGSGGIGQALRARLEPFEVDVMLMGRSARPGVVAIESLPEQLPRADVVVLAVPLDATTRHLVDADFLARMRPGALLVNVSRGGVVDTDALLAAAQEGRVTAALDVTEPEPLPPDHPLWHTPGVLVTPHVGGNTTAFEPRARRLVERQLVNWHTGAPLESVVHVG